ncbi:hypothetical protein JW935_10055 [candidate division KSB1 bacterium]|nr:hypothetical protein [candidate division KSB1 bacterium]
MGPSAHSFNGEKRWWNKATVRGYIEDINQFLLPVEAREILTDSQQLDEFLLLGLRQYEGIPLELFQSKFPRASALNNNIGYDHDVPPFAPSPSGKLLTIFKHHLCLTQQGLLLYNTVCENLTANIKIV